VVVQLLNDKQHSGNSCIQITSSPSHIANTFVQLASAPNHNANAVVQYTITVGGAGSGSGAFDNAAFDGGAFDSGASGTGAVSCNVYVQDLVSKTNTDNAIVQVTQSKNQYRQRYCSGNAVPGSYCQRLCTGFG
jgi:hypothetical protein